MKPELPAVKESYAIMRELQRGLNASLRSYKVNDKELIEMKLTYQTLDGKIHVLTETLMELK